MREPGAGIGRDIAKGERADADREVWVGSEGFAFDGSRLYGYSRNGTAG
jgi:hypothetical protein